MYIKEIQDWTREQKTLTDKELQNIIESGKFENNDIICGTSGLVVSSILKIANEKGLNSGSEEVMGGIQEGFIIVGEAIKNYKKELGITFSTYISKKIVSNFINTHVYREKYTNEVLYLKIDDGEDIQDIEIEDITTNTLTYVEDRLKNKKVFNKIKQTLTRKEYKLFKKEIYQEPIKSKLGKVFRYFKMI